MGIAFGVLLLIALFSLASSIRITQEYERAVVFRLGRFLSVRGPGLILLVPIIERARRVDLRTVTLDLESQEAITSDSVTIKVSAILWYRVKDPARSILSVEDYEAAIYEIAVTTLRNILGQHELDHVITDRDRLNASIKKFIDKATEAWGVEVEMLEIKDVEIPEAMQRAMAREAEAIREKRARIIKAEAEFESSRKLSQGAAAIAKTPLALELRRMQMITEIGVEQNTSTIVLMPSEFSELARSISKRFNRSRKK
jgi:regulator of protease activity HflC (stomatin/prohibitin superfamily)